MSQGVQTRRACCSRTRGSCPGAACSRMSASASLAAGAPKPTRHCAPWGSKTGAATGPRCCRAASGSAWRQARATLVSQPRLLLLDEPLGALDALTRLEMQALIESVWQTQGFTVVLVTHDVTEAVALADRVIVLDAGSVAQELRVPQPRPRRRGSAPSLRRSRAGCSPAFCASAATRRAARLNPVPSVRRAER